MGNSGEVGSPGDPGTRGERGPMGPAGAIVSIGHCLMILNFGQFPKLNIEFMKIHVYKFEANTQT